MSQLQMSALTAVVKERWPNGLPKSPLFQKHALLGMLQEEQFHESIYNIPVQDNLAGSRSHDASIAFAGEVSSNYLRFQVTPVSNYSRAKFEGKALRSLNKTNALQVLKTIENEFTSATERFGNSMAQEAYRSNSGAVCQVHASTAPSGTTLTLDYPSSARYFYKDAQVQASQNDAGSLRDSGDYVTVTNVDWEEGKLTGDGTWTTVISGLAVGDYLYIRGDAQNGGTAVAAAGLAGWCPSTVTSTAFFGVDRTAGTKQARAGWRISATGESMETIFIRAQAQAQIAGFSLDTVFIHPNDVSRLEKAKEGTREVKEGKYEIGTRQFYAYGANFVVDADAQEGTAWAVDVKGGAFKLLTNGKVPLVDDTDGSMFSRISGADAYEARLVGDYQFGGFMPWRIMRITLPSAT